MREFFRIFATRTSQVVGSAWTFIVAVVAIVLWACTGPIFQYSNTWQLVINTGTTIVTFLMVFLIQNTQNRDSRSMQLKLDELIRAVNSARTGMVDLEDLSDADLDRLQEQFRQMREQEEAAAGPRRDHASRES
ncbi:MAG TPA: low affinity iron permease family protein [Longimicrobiaceae bacterium]|nr:low affinity iron permease family protein [Longimicrobiaceae bacterium]